MEHVIFLIQMISLALVLSSLIILSQKFINSRQKSILFFIAAIFVIFLRVIIFALARYGQVSRFFVFPVRFVNLPIAGLVYVTLIFTSHILLLWGMYSLLGWKPHLLTISLFLVPTLYSLILFSLLLHGIKPAPYSYWIFSIESLTIIPILTVKLLLLFYGIRLSWKIYSDKKRQHSRLYAFFFIILGLGQVFDGIFYAFEPFRYITLLLSMILPFSAYLIFLPLLINKEYSSDFTSQFNDKLINSFCNRYKLSKEEKDIVKSIIQGKSNKEIAFDNETTLSIIKHRIFVLYKKCSINSRWELINLLVN
jgi:hypothetical protein